MPLKYPVSLLTAVQLKIKLTLGYIRLIFNLAINLIKLKQQLPCNA